MTVGDKIIVYLIKQAIQVIQLQLQVKQQKQIHLHHPAFNAILFNKGQEQKVVVIIIRHHVSLSNISIT